MPNQRLQYLFDQYVQGNCSSEEKRELSALALAMQNDREVQELLDGYWDIVTGEMRLPEEKSEAIVESILNSEMKVIPKTHRTSLLLRMTNKKWWAAAAIFILFASGTYFLFFNNKGSKQVEIVKTEPVRDVKAPISNRAMITLADGKTVYLDSADNGQLAVQGNIKLVKLANGQIAYQASSNPSEGGALVHNMLTNPRGSKAISMTLADGSMVWLNAGSSVTFPVVFVGDERKVTITGEAYFEVAHHPSMPFIVNKGEASVQVLGTHFNVNAYDDEVDIKVTLLEGSVKVSNDQSALTIKPNQQAIVKNNGIVLLNANVDIEEVMAWKNGKFVFGSTTDLQNIMRQIARWYNVEVLYEGEVPRQRFGGEMPRSSNLSQVLEILKTSGVKFSIDGRKIIIK